MAKGNSNAEGVMIEASSQGWIGHNKHDLATMKLKLELAKLKREQQQEAIHMKEREVALAKEALQLRKEEAAIRKEEQEREAALRERETVIRKEQERETVLLRERERVQFEAKHRHLEMQREHDKKQADMAIECRQREVTLETTDHTQRQQATSSLPVSFNISHAKNELLYRRYRPSKLKEDDDWANVEQLVIPTSIRPDILHLAH
ncbi:uncharacterized protein [Procambarus clarkii]|uniref:uncharacterized protein n=1 Tax=Procambarus clarkii TaxID=6728 RepID=UPI00374454BB